jgi:hypothetical protein
MPTLRVISATGVPSRFSRDRHHTICMPTDFDAPLPGEILEVFS